MSKEDPQAQWAICASGLKMPCIGTGTERLSAMSKDKKESKGDPHVPVKRRRAESDVSSVRRTLFVLDAPGIDAGV